MLILTWVLIVVISLLFINNLWSLISGKDVSSRVASLIAMIINALVVYVLVNHLNCLS